jgi:hypothetical protein
MNDDGWIFSALVCLPPRVSGSLHWRIFCGLLEFRGKRSRSVPPALSLNTTDSETPRLRESPGKIRGGLAPIPDLPDLDGRGLELQDPSWPRGCAHINLIGALGGY